MPSDNTPSDEGPDDFQQQAHQSQPGLFQEFWHFLRYNKKWWLLPIILILLLAGVLVTLAGSPLAPFLYPFF